MDEYREANRALWDAWTELHVGSKFYDVAGFKAGRLSLKPLELREVGTVTGKRLLHLQCHFGLDTLSWARLGANVTGIDFSERAISTARSLARELGIPAKFVQSTVEDLAANMAGEYDIVFTSYGVLDWLPRLQPWADTIARFLARDGVFHLIEFHPFATTLDEQELKPTHPYIARKEPMIFEGSGSYASPGAQFRSHEWPHALSDVFNSLIGAGLRIEKFEEYPFSSYNIGVRYQQRAPDEWVIPELPDFPLMYSIRARRQ